MKSKITKLSPFWTTIRAGNSLTALVVILFSTTLISFVSILFYMNIQLTSFTFTSINEEREGNFKEIVYELKTITKAIETGVLQLDGFCNFFTPKLLKRFEVDGNGQLMNERKIIKSGYTQLKQFENSLGFNEFMFGHFIYEQEAGRWKYASSYVRMNGDFWIGNGTEMVNYTVVNVYPNENLLLPNEEDINSHFYDLDDSKHALTIVDEATIEFYATPHANWDYWFGDGTGWFSFSVSQRVNDVFNGSHPHNVSCNSWNGLDLQKFSQILKEWTPEGSFSWMIELNLGYLLGVSNFESLDEVFDVENQAFQQASQAKNTEIAFLSDFILSDTSQLQIIKENIETVVKYRALGYDLQLVYTNSSYQGAWLFVNAQSLLSIYWSSIVTITLTISFCFLYIAVVIAFWVFIFISVFFQFRKLLQNLGKIEEMNLDAVDIDLKKCSFTFFEIYFINRHIKYMANKLLEFKNFLPSHLFFQENVTESQSDRSSQVSGASQLSSNYSQCSQTSSNASAIVGIHGVKGGKSTSSKNSMIEKKKNQRKAMFQIGLSSKNILCMIIEFKDNLTKNNIKMQERFEKVFRTIQRFNGHILTFASSKIKVIFHYDFFKAFQLIEDLQKFSTEEITFFCAIGNCYLGNIGSSNRKQFSCEGKVMKKIDILVEKVPKKVKIPVVMCEECFDFMNQLEMEYETRLIDCTKFENSSRNNDDEINVFDDEEIKIYELGRKKTIDSDEWLYEVSQLESFKRWDLYNVAMKLFVEKKIDEAKEKMSQFLNSEPNDQLGNYWIKKWNN